MLKFFKFWEKREKSLDVWETSIIKSTSALFGVIIGAYAASFVIENIAIIFSTFLLGVVYLMIKVYLRKS